MQAAAEAVRPLQTYLELAALPSAVPCARGHFRAVAHEWGLGELADTAELLASELVSNAIRAAESLRTRADQALLPVVRITIVLNGSDLVIRVWDASDDMPVRQEARPGDDSGRGLMIIDALSADWGAYREPDGGKVVWAAINHTASS
jgi:anti-sigma regulatory factor (Ser/Thr protein kinase)